MLYENDRHRQLNRKNIKGDIFGFKIPSRKTKDVLAKVVVKGILSLTLWSQSGFNLYLFPRSLLSSFKPTVFRILKIVPRHDYFGVSPIFAFLTQFTVFTQEPTSIVSVCEKIEIKKNIHKSYLSFIYAKSMKTSTYFNIGIGRSVDSIDEWRCVSLWLLCCCCFLFIHVFVYK